MKRRKKIIRTHRRTGLVLKSNQRLMLLLLFYVTGSFIGAVAVKGIDGEMLVHIKELAESFVQQRNTQSILQNFLSSVLTDTVYTIIAAVFGLCLIGEPILWLIPLARGLGIGFISGYFLKTYTLSGFMYCLSILFVPSMLSVAATVFMCREAIITSKDLFRSTGGSAAVKKSDFYKLYALRFILLYAIMILAALVSAALTYAFSGKIILTL